jgi:hypothetical protein
MTSSTSEKRDQCPRQLYVYSIMDIQNLEHDQQPKVGGAIKGSIFRQSSAGLSLILSRQGTNNIK